MYLCYTAVVVAVGKSGELCGGFVSWRRREERRRLENQTNHLTNLRAATATHSGVAPELTGLHGAGCLPPKEDYLAAIVPLGMMYV